MALPGVQEESGFFNAQELSEGVYDREYDASQFAEYFSNFISNGVYINPANQLKVEFVSERTVKVKSGKAFLLGYWYKLKEDATVTIPPNSTSGDIVTSICITYDKISRQANLTVRENVGSALPRNDDRYFDLVIWTVTIKPATSVLSPSLMQDRRPDKKYCGYVAAVVTDIDTTDLFKQFTDAFNEWFDNEKEAIEQAIDNTMINDDTPSNVTTYSSEKIENIKLGLESGDVKENVVTFEDAQSRVNISSGETLGTIFGKIKKFFSDLKNVAFTGSYLDLTNRPTLGSAASKSVANNLTTNISGSVLDARQGRALDQKISSLNSALAVKESWVTTNTEEVTNVKHNNVMMSGYTVRIKLVFNLIKANNDYHEVLVGTLPEGYRPRTEEVFFYSDGSGTLITFSVNSNGNILMYPSSVYEANTQVFLIGTYI